jgi:hypothetical protein
MSNAVTDGGIYANGRTHAEHCAWLDSLQPDSDEYRIVYMPRGHLFNLAERRPFHVPAPVESMLPTKDSGLTPADCGPSRG